MKASSSTKCTVETTGKNVKASFIPSLSQCFMLNQRVSLIPTCQRMDGEGLMGLNDIHLEFKVHGTAASQGNSMAYARDRWKKMFFMIWYQQLMEAWLVVWKNKSRQEGL